ncbi:hypothetical protein LTR17_010000 [Elasticomyces elasticus]|nr:hypothetical protein LTR17_010000 [Elasticomyces elasticus]
MSGYSSNMPPLDDDDYDDFDPRSGLDSYDRRPGMMDPPGGPSMHLPGGPMDDPMTDDGPFNDDLYDDMLRERHDSPPTPLGFDEDRHREGAPSPESPEGFAMGRDTLEDDMYLGQPPIPKGGGGLQGTRDDDYREYRSLLTQGSGDDGPPTASNVMPHRYRGEDPLKSFNEVEDMPEGAVGAVGAHETRNWGFPGHYGPNMYPAEMVDQEFIDSRNADPDFSPPSIPGSQAEKEDRLRFH